MLDDGHPVCIRAGITAKEVKEIGSKYQCVACLLSKRRSQSEGFQSPIDSKNAIAGQMISLDPVGPISPMSLGGFTLMWCVYDVGSSYQWVYFSKSKEAAVVIQILELVLADLVFYGKETRIVRSDAEEVFSSREVQSFLREKGIKSQFSLPESCGESYSTSCSRNFSLDAFSKILACLLLGTCSEAYGEDREVCAFE